jgi:hypothetical protein
MTGCATAAPARTGASSGWNPETRRPPSHRRIVNRFILLIYNFIDQ